MIKKHKIGGCAKKNGNKKKIFNHHNLVLATTPFIGTCQYNSDISSTYQDNSIKITTKLLKLYREKKCYIVCEGLKNTKRWNLG